MYYDVSTLPNNLTRFNIFDFGKEFLNLDCHISYDNSFIKFTYLNYKKNFSITIEKISGVLNIETKFDSSDCNFLQLILKITATEIKKLNLLPQINICEDDLFLQKIAISSNFKKIPTLGKFQFSIWKYLGGWKKRELNEYTFI